VYLRSVSRVAVVAQLEAAMEDWSKLVATVVEQENAKKPKGKEPLAEIEFWRQRNAALSALYEQINMPNVQAMLKVLQLVEAPMLGTFNYSYSELQKLYVRVVVIGLLYGFTAAAPPRAAPATVLLHCSVVCVRWGSCPLPRAVGAYPPRPALSVPSAAAGNATSPGQDAG
jgi:hypothetical protein